MTCDSEINFYIYIHVMFAIVTTRPFSLPQIISYALGVYIALLFTCQLHESLIKLYFKQCSIVVNVRNIKINVFLKASRAVVIGWFSLNEAPLGLFKFISDYLPCFEKINIFFNIKTKTFWINLQGLIEIIWSVHSK
jgi:hypothetical protein